MDIDAIILSVIASVPEIIVIVGACVLLMIAPVRGRRFGPLLFWSSLATVIAAAAATFAECKPGPGSGETRRARPRPPRETETTGLVAGLGRKDRALPLHVPGD